MRIVQLLLPRSSEYERKCQRIDFEALGDGHEVVLAEDSRTVPSADVALVYGQPPRRMPIPFIATERPRRRFGMFDSARPAIVVSPVNREGVEYLPEAVGREWFSQRGQATPATEKARLHTVGSLRRASINSIVEQTMPRLHRTRDDVQWLLLDTAPAPEDMARFDAWIDPAVSEEDFDGFVAEALVAGKAVVASRTAINLQRLEKGRTGFLVPPGDANELTHAILAALFKTEVARQRIEAAGQTISKFLPRQRLRVLAHMLETLHP